MAPRTLFTIAGLALGICSNAQASLIGDTINIQTNLAGNITFTDNTQSHSVSPVVGGGSEYGDCIRAAGSGQVCGPSGISFQVDVGASSIQFQLFGSTGSTGTTTWVFTDLDVGGMIVGVTPNSADQISVQSFTDDSVTFTTTRTNWVGGFFPTFTLETQAAPEPGVLALLGLGLVGLGVARRRAA